MSSARRKVLLIDDSEISLKLTATVLERAGYEVRTSSDVGALGGLLGSWRPDVILTDVVMPGLSGVELCRLLKSRYETAHVPVVLLSVVPTDELERMAQDCEAEGFVSKTSGLERLPGELARFFETTLF